MGAITNGASSLLVASMGFLSGMAYSIDMGDTFNTYNISPTPEAADRVALANDWQIVGDEIRKAMAAYEKNC